MQASRSSGLVALWRVQLAYIRLVNRTAKAIYQRNAAAGLPLPSRQGMIRGMPFVASSTS